MAKKQPDLFRGLILENAFISVSNLLGPSFSVFKTLKEWTLDIKWDNSAIVPNLSLPIFFTAGTKDSKIPYEHTLKLHNLSKKCKFKDIYIVDGG